MDRLNWIKGKGPIGLEFLLNGFFILYFTLFRANNLPELFLPLNDSFFSIFKYSVPFSVFIVFVGHLIVSQHISIFLRKYIFTLIILVPLVISFGDLELSYWLVIVHLFSSFLTLSESRRERIHNVRKKSVSLIQRLQLKPAQMVMISFAVIILAGSSLLYLPLSSKDGTVISAIDAFFMATSATCVTGLATLSVSDNFSLFGQLIMLALMQIGGLGMMTLSSTMTIILGRSLGMKEKIFMQDLLEINSLEDLIELIVDIVRYTLLIELWGGIVLTIAFSFEGFEIEQALYYGFFHSISAFCNAGFSLFNNSIENFSTNPLINLTLVALIIIGGLGFIVLKELRYAFKNRVHFRDFSLHCKIVLITHFSLIGLGALAIFFSEFLHSLDTFSLIDKLQISFFQSVTTRSSGFNTISLDSMHSYTLYFMCLLMFVGAAPGSTGGGIKVTTFAILIQSIKTTLKGGENVEFFDRRISNSTVVRATAITIISIMIASFFILIMMKVEPFKPFLSVFFEVLSAFSTVGLSLGVTGDLSMTGKLVIASLMFIGRVGPLTLAFALGQKNPSSGKVEYPEGRIMIG